MQRLCKFYVKAFAYEYQLTTSSFEEAAMNYGAKQRALARRLVAEGQTYAAHGDKKRAANCFLDAMLLRESPMLRM